MSWSYGDDYEYANSRVSDTIVTHAGKPFYVYEVANDLTAYGHYLNMTPDDCIRVPCQEVDLTPVKLGYANADYVVFTSRIPARRYKQGLRRDSMARIKMGGGGYVHHLSDASMFQVIMGIYPTLKEVVDKIRSHRIGGAWSRNWAVDAKMRVWYKGVDNVGLAHAEGVVKLKPEFEFLKEALEESL